MYTFAVLYSSVTLYIDRHTYAMSAEFVELLGARVMYCVVIDVVYIYICSVV